MIIGLRVVCWVIIVGISFVIFVQQHPVLSVTVNDVLLGVSCMCLVIVKHVIVATGWICG